jgi:hypothetical protein
MNVMVRVSNRSNNIMSYRELGRKTFGDNSDLIVAKKCDRENRPEKIKQIQRCTSDGLKIFLFDRQSNSKIP